MCVAFSFAPALVNASVVSFLGFCGFASLGSVAVSAIAAILFGVVFSSSPPPPSGEGPKDVLAPLYSSFQVYRDSAFEKWSLISPRCRLFFNGIFPFSICALLYLIVV